MHDEFRVKVGVVSGDVDSLIRALEAADPEVRDGGHIAVSHGSSDVFLYADSAALADEAKQIVQTALTSSGVRADISVWRWHPVEESWEDAAAPMPDSDAARAAEHARLTAQENAESVASGRPQWEVSITLPSHHDAREMGERLEAEGIPVIRRWRHLVVGANTEDDAKALRKRLEGEAPQGSELTVEGSGLVAYDQENAPAKRLRFFGLAS